MKKLHFQIILTTFLAFLFTSCVSYRKYEDTLNAKNSCEEENAGIKSESEKIAEQFTALNENVISLDDQVKKLRSDTAILGTTKRLLSINYDHLMTTYELLDKKNKELLAGNVAETEKISNELSLTQENLLKKEDELRKLERELNAKEKTLDGLSAQLKNSMKSVEAKEAELSELQSILARKDSVVKALKDKVSGALLGFQNKGLTVTEKNGKVYVSLENKLLFASGSYQVGKEGIKALKELAKVLEENQDISIMIEGHTDNDSYNGSNGIKDNWDLSVKRATSIVKILINNSSIDPKRLTAAGRSKYVPVDEADTKEAKAKNRRTEIILTPKLDELLKILDSN